uniref:Transmembrane protein n=1 Tax=Kalanchoe fedtschenkoi TaxID=63787 RepID=A0A7N0UB28_KALFE
MDVEPEEMQFLGLFGILKQSFKLIYTWRNIFIRITLALILPLSFILLAHIEITHLMLSQLISNEITLAGFRIGSNKYEKLSDLITSEVIALSLFKVAYFTFFLIFSLLSTSAVVYTVASAYASREFSFGGVMRVVPKVWRRLMATFMCMFIAMFVYNFCFGVGVILCDVFIGFSGTEIVILSSLFVLYLAGLVYMSLVWQLASVVSVLEESYGLRALVKSKNLLKGKLVVPGFIFLVLNILAGVVQSGFQMAVVDAEEAGMVRRVAFGILTLLLLMGLILFWLVVQTVIYFVCKSYHHESIDKSLLSDHLELYLGEYVPLKAGDVQLEHFDV